MREIKFEKDEAQYLLNNLSSDKVADKIKKKVERAMHTISVASRKGKGREFQYATCRMISEAIDIPYDQHDPDCNIHSTEMGQSGVDIILRNEARKKFPFNVECKAQENLDIPGWVKQAKANNQVGMDWLLCVKKQSIGTPLAIVSLECFMSLIKQLNEYKEKEMQNQDDGK